ncbi:hypothetical protein AB395_00001221 [Sinorhizobium fredii CCBAU 45436]|nr:hypothetical protein SF83666_c11910 [Sinorhizobium fredii CCBAU 83666]AWI56889.1 hypothetical protein AB395_00001221 [Sinorhizobium fredii CCBAU 45436]AWM24693.1 hypothetical protein AOX55_00001426 [Sinorhizobium fredii CCBAU 25509]
MSPIRDRVENRYHLSSFIASSKRPRAVGFSIYINSRT